MMSGNDDEGVGTSASVGEQTRESEALPELPEGYEYGPGTRRGLPPEYIPVAKFLTSLSRFARSLGFYNDQNRALKVVFDTLWEEIGILFSTYPELTLRADASRFYLEDEIVYEDTDREHSIPFRLFRDGVRSVTFDSSVGRDELLTLSKILGMRLTGVNRDGDDVVTRMWKADFKAIQYAEVRGFVPASMVGQMGGGGYSAQSSAPGAGTMPEVIQRIHGGKAHVATAGKVAPSIEGLEDVVPRWMEGVYPGVGDYDLDYSGTAVEIAYPEITDAEQNLILNELEKEEKNVLTRLVDYLLDLCMSEEETFRPEQLFQLVADGKRYLLSESLIDELTNLVDFLVDVETSGEYAEVMEEISTQLLDDIASREVLEQILAATRVDGDGPWHLREFLRTIRDRLDADRLRELLRSGMPDVLRRVLLDSMLEFTDRDVSVLAEQLREEEELDVVTAMDALAALDTPDAREVLARTIRHPNEKIRLHLLSLYEYFPYEEATRRALIWALNDASRAVRIRALEMVAKRKDPGAVAALQELAEHADFVNWNQERRDLLMRAIASVGGATALPWLEEHIRTPRIWRLLSTEQRTWNEAVLPALVEVGSEAALSWLRKLKDYGPPEARKKALRAYLELDRRLREALTADDDGERS